LEQTDFGTSVAQGLGTAALDLGPVVSVIDPHDQDRIALATAAIGQPGIANQALIACGHTVNDIAASCVVFDAHAQQLQVTSPGANILFDLPLAVNSNGSVFPATNPAALELHYANSFTASDGTQYADANTLTKLELTSPHGSVVVNGEAPSLIDQIGSFFSSGIVSAAEPSQTATSIPTVRPYSTATLTPSETEPGPLYPACGPNPHLYDGASYAGFPKGPDGRGLPTGQATREDLRIRNLDTFEATACLQSFELDSATNVIHLKAGFYNTQAQFVEYEFLLGGQSSVGTNLGVDVGLLGPQIGTYQTMSTQELAGHLQAILDSESRTREFHINIAFHDHGEPWNLAGDTINGNSPFLNSLQEALVSGTNFPTTGTPMVGAMLSLIIPEN